MNDLRTLQAALTPDEPSQDVVDRSRHRLQNRMRGSSAARKRTVWWTAGIGLTAAAAAAVVVVVTVSTMPAAPADRAPATAVAEPPTTTVGGQEILLAAAVAAERSPEETGTYWHVRVAEGASASNTYEYWVKPDGQSWTRGAKTNGAVVALGASRSKPFSLVAVDLTLDQLRALPADPAALKAWIAQALTHSDARTSAGPLTASDREQATFQSLISLVSTLPAPPQVRAAAFRAIASYPGVHSLGEVPGGQGLSLPDNGGRLVVDPTTGRVNRTSVYVTMDGALYGVADTAGAQITAEWTNTLPK